MKIKIRLMELADYEAVYQLWSETPGMGLNSLDDSKSGIEIFLHRNPATCFVAEKDGQIVGAIMTGNDGRRGYIYHMCTQAKLRKKGIAGLLLTNSLEALKLLGIKKAALVVFKKNQSGNDFWEKQGFKQRDDLVYRDCAFEYMKRIDT